MQIDPAAPTRRIDTDAVGRRIASVRALRSLTQAELAERAGVAEATVHRAEQGRMSLVSISKMGKALDTRLEYLVWGEGAP